MESGSSINTSSPTKLNIKVTTKKKMIANLKKVLIVQQKLILSSVEKKRIENSLENNIGNTATPHFSDFCLIVPTPHTLYYQQSALFLGKGNHNINVSLGEVVTSHCHGSKISG